MIPYPTPSKTVWAVSTFSSQPDRFFDLTGLTWEQEHDLKQELRAQGYFVREVFVEDNMTMLLAAEIRKRTEKEVESPS